MTFQEHFFLGKVVLVRSLVAASQILRNYRNVHFLEEGFENFLLVMSDNVYLVQSFFGKQVLEHLPEGRGKPCYF